MIHVGNLYFTNNFVYEKTAMFMQKCQRPMNLYEVWQFKIISPTSVFETVLLYFNNNKTYIYSIVLFFTKDIKGNVKTYLSFLGTPPNCSINSENAVQVVVPVPSPTTTTFDCRRGRILLRDTSFGS